MFWISNKKLNFDSTLLSKGPSLYLFRSKIQITCPEHPDAPLVEDYHAGDMICPECGLVVGDR